MDCREIISSCYCGDAAEKIEMAGKMLEQFGPKLLQDKAIVLHLRGLKTAVATLDAHMTAMEMGKTCSRCAANPQGGCCSEYMGNENNDALQLLMNMLAGVEVKQVCSNGVECCFLGERGCILLFKPIFCLNYLCHRIQKKSGKEELKELEMKTGFLLGGQVELEQVIIRFLTEILKAGR